MEEEGGGGKSPEDGQPWPQTYPTDGIVLQRKYVFTGEMNHHRYLFVAGVIDHAGGKLDCLVIKSSHIGCSDRNIDG